jgi:hypothetical protein
MTQSVQKEELGMWKAVMCLAFFTLLSAAVSAQQLVMMNGYHYIALRDFSQDVGAVVGFDDSRNAISLTLGYQTVEVIPYSTTAWINGNPVTIPHTVVITDDVTYLPFRFMCHALNLSATWSNNNQQVVVVNPYTELSVPFLINLSFGQRPHVYRRDYNVQQYRNLPPPPPARRGPTSNPYGLNRPGTPPRTQGAGQPQGGAPRSGARPTQPQGGNTRTGGNHNGQPQGGTSRGGGRTVQPQSGGNQRGSAGGRGDTRNNGR